jgi:hypothetical protein
MWGKIKHSYSFRLPITPGDCFRTCIQHVRENKGQLLKDSYSFGTPWLHIVIAFVHLYGMWGPMWEIIKDSYSFRIPITPGDCFCTYIRHVRKNKYSFGTPSLHLVIAFVVLLFRSFIRHFVLLYGMWGEIKDSYSLGIPITPGDCFCTFIRHVRENKYSFGTPSLHLVISYVLLHFVLLYGMRGEIKDSYSFTIPLTPGDCFRSFTRHFEVLTDYTWWLLLYIYTACEGK